MWCLFWVLVTPEKYLFWFCLFSRKFMTFWKLHIAQKTKNAVFHHFLKHVFRAKKWAEFKKLHNIECFSKWPKNVSERSLGYLDLQKNIFLNFVCFPGKLWYFENCIYRKKIEKWCFLTFFGNFQNVINFLENRQN